MNCMGRYCQTIILSHSRGYKYLELEPLYFLLLHE